MIDTTKAFHVGLAVEDLDAAMQSLEATMGLRFHPPQDFAVPVLVHGEVRDVELVFTYSVQGPQHVELTVGPPDSPWAPSSGPGIHHLGLWSSDVRGEAQALVSRGCVMEVAGLADDGGVGGFALLVTPMGARFELVDTSMGPMFARWFAGGTFLE